MPNKQIIGITGLLGTGKTTVAKLLSRFGFYHIDADKVAHKILEQNRGEIIKILGEEVLEDGEISRKKIGEIVFNDEKKRERFNAFIHPEIIREVFRRVKEVPSSVIIDGALIFELNLEDKFNWIICVTAPYETMVKRMAARAGYSREMVERVIKSQLSEEEKRQRADFIIENTGTVEELEKKVEEVWEKIKA